MNGPVTIGHLGLGISDHVLLSRPLHASTASGNPTHLPIRPRARPAGLASVDTRWPGKAPPRKWGERRHKQGGSAINTYPRNRAGLYNGTAVHRFGPGLK
jgi:hypothetical protein